jgi:DNA invertase Pin-like site-specific DNA recombinase
MAEDTEQLPEERQAAALRALADAADQLRHAEAVVRAAALNARSVGLSVNRSAARAKVSRSTVDRWLREAEAERLKKQVSDDNTR